MITEREIAELQALCDKATPGEWLKGSWRGQCHLDHQHGGGDCVYEFTFDTTTSCVSTVVENHELIGWDDYGQILSSHDAAFIAASRAALPRLLAELKQLKIQLKKGGD